MALLVKATADQFILGSSFSVSGRIFLCTPKDDKNSQVIAKKLSTKQNTFTDYKAQGDKLKSSLMKSLYILMPDQIYEHEKEVYIIMPKMVRSAQDVIQEYRRQGKLVPIKLVKRILNDSVQGLKKVHSKKLFHGHIKPGNILQNDEEDWNLSDFGVFSSDTGEDYWSPEQVQNVSKGARLGASQIDQVLEQQRNDIYSLGITLLILATLKKPSEYFCFRDGKQNAIQDVKDKLDKTYGEAFCRIVDSMLQPFNKRKKITELDNLIEQFLQIPDIDFDDSECNILELSLQKTVEPDTAIIMDEFKARVIGKRETIQDYLKKYELNLQNSKILCSNFYQSLDDLQLNLNTQEKAALEKNLDPKDTGYFDLSQIIKHSLVGQIKMFDLKPQEMKSLKELLGEMNIFIQENQINLLEKFTILDKIGKRYLDVTEFNEALTDLGLGLQNDDLKLVRLRFDPEKKGVIYYDFFCEEMMDSNVGQELGLDGILDLIYAQIREHFNTLDAFLKRYDTSQRGHLKDTEFTTFMNEFNINPSNAVMRGLIERLDPKGKKIILYDNFRNTLQDRVDAELKRMINSICGFLKKENKYFIPLCKSQTKSNRIISPEKLFDALRSINSTIKRPELDFLINQLKADKQESIEYQDFSASLIKLAKQLGVQMFQYLGDSPKKEYYDDYDEQEEEQQTQAKEYQIDGCRNFLLAIMSALDAKRKGPASFFPKSMQRQEFRDKLRELQVDYRDYNDEWDELMQIILVKNQVNGYLLSQMLIEVTRGQQQKQTKNTFDKPIDQYENQQATVQITQMIRKIMKQRDIDEHIFRDIDTMNEGLIKLKDFEKQITQLGIDIEDTKQKNIFNQ